MHRVTSAFLVAFCALNACAEVNVPTFDQLLSRHCAYQCHKQNTHPASSTGNVMNATLVKEIVEEKLLAMERSLYPGNCQEVVPRLAKVTNSTGGVFNIYPLEIAVLEVYCDTTTEDGGWTVFQRRMDGSVEFNLDWKDFVEGFGYRQGEFWLGLENIYQLTRNGSYELRIDMIQTDGTSRTAKYDTFSIGPASDYYRLTVGGYSGNASDGLSPHNNRQFSTKDSDHDTASSSNCASYYKGAWWHHACYDSHLNGVYDATNSEGVRWWLQEEPKSALFLSFTEMKFRKTN